MANTISADVITTGGSLRVEPYLDLVGGARPATLYVTHSRGRHILRGWDRKVVASAGYYLAVDHEAPLGEPLNLFLQVGDDAPVEYWNNPIILGRGLPMVSDPIRGGSVSVTIQSWPDWAYERAGKALEISDSKFPVIIDGAELGATSTVTLIAHDQSAADRLVEMLEDRSLLQIRPSCPNMEGAWVSARGRRRRRFSARTDSAFVDTIDLLHMGRPPLSVEAVGSTLGQLNTAIPGTLGDIHAAWPGALRDIVRELIPA